MKKSPDFNIEVFRRTLLSKETKASEARDNTLPARYCRGAFVRGPLPLAWFTPAAKLPGKALHVGLAVWFEHGRRKKDEFKLTTAILKRFGVGRKAGYRALGALSREGLIEVRRAPGKNPTVTLRHLESSKPKGQNDSE